MIRRLLLAAVFLCTALPAFASGQLDLKAVARELTEKGGALVAAYDPAAGAAAANGFSDLYFDVFEGSGMEEAVALRSPSEKAELESLFADIIGKAGQGRPRPEIAAAWATLAGRLDDVAAVHTEPRVGALATLIQSFLILLREGFEAMLVVTALVTYLRRAGETAKIRIIWHGIAWALAASLISAWLLTAVLDLGGQGQEVLEGAVMLIAAAVLFYVTFWLLSKREAANWHNYVKSQVETAAAGGRAWALGLAAFLAVYREGAETVLFYKALALSAPGELPALLAGFGLGAVALAIVFWAMRTLSFRLPIKLFFSVTAGLLFTLAVSFAGTGVLELQEGRLLPITPIAFVPRIEWLGLFPTAESLAAQLALLLPMAAAIIWHLKRGRAAPS